MIFFKEVPSFDMFCLVFMWVSKDVDGVPLSSFFVF